MVSLQLDPSMRSPPGMGPPSSMGSPSSVDSLLNFTNGNPIGAMPPAGTVPNFFSNGHPLVAMPPPPGVVPNFVNPVSRGSYLITVNAVLLSITTLFVLMRFYTRIFLARAIGWDDCIVFCFYIFPSCC